MITKIFLFFFLTISLSYGNIFYVSNAGDDIIGNGDIEKPWKTLQYAINQVYPGDKIIVKNGVYPENISWKNARNGEEGNIITLSGEGETIVHRFEIDKSYWKIENFIVKGFDQEFFAHVQLENGAHFIIFENNIVDNDRALYQLGIAMSTSGGGPFNENWPSNCIFRNNKITKVRGRAALMISGKNNLFENNFITELYSADMIRLFGDSNIIKSNEFSLNQSEDSIGYHPDFVQTFGNNGIGSKNHIIEGNFVHDCATQIAQLVEGTASSPDLIGTGAIGGWVFRNNIFANFKLGTSLTIPNTKWYNNVFYKVNYNGGHAIGGGLSDRGSSEGIRVFNNVFLDCGLLDRNNSGWYTINENYEDKEFNYNYVSKNNFNPVREENPPSSFRWFEENGINGGDPGFVNPENYNFNLLETSILRGKGKKIDSFDYDYNGNARGLSWDIGPFQYSESATPPTPENLKIKNP